MTVEINTLDSAIPEQEQEFHWQECWYPICFVQDLPKNRPYSFSLYEEPFVLFKNQDGQLVCLSDRCPHRAAKLSDGQIIDGKIECLYHGWQFGSDGECLHIPQLPKDAKIPAHACVRSFPVVEHQSMVWMWASATITADEKRIPAIAELDKPETVSMDYMRDLPYEQSFLIENIIDPAHVFIAHDGSDGNRKYAQPLDIEVVDNSVWGIYGKWRIAGESRGFFQNWQKLDFIAPNLVHYQFSAKNPDWSLGLAIYSLPLGKNRCRILLRRYRNFMTCPMQFMPRWFHHLRQNRILEEDMSVVVGQQAEIQRLGNSLKEIFLPLKTSDTLVIEYRKWLDKFGLSLPYYQGYSTSKNIHGNNSDRHQQTPTLDRLSQHIHICNSCHQAYRVSDRLKQTFVGIAIALAALAIITDSSSIQLAAVSTSVVAVVLAIIAQKVKTRLERPYNRQAKGWLS
ncbi:Rieske 2Fe-2S domain-containing protein [Fischerella sp. JS2]|uniref:aromatic ring-hydroxylating dioxygenase subunit alpha n=1 Tax=Fischerella sp. JS2 TaxID=2597771 RepID=UPI0028E894BC|nr:Rieske 2Fe-2S domain-containing protein [Fischerella sp. JS2]